ncbi:MAG: UDP-N-acetylmuramoyl-L-alanine--D-glutamate ligase [bacterium]
MTLSEYIADLKGKRVAVLGVGVSNRPLLRLLLDAGIEVCARDKNPLPDAAEWEKLGAKLVQGEGYLDDIEADVIFRSPGIRPDVPGILAALEKGARLTSEMEAFFEVCPCPILAVTGSDGKTTTTTVISEILKADGKRVWLGGNIGTPLLDQAEKMRPEDWCVLELSSFQLMTLHQSPAIAVVTNLAPNHLDWHRDMAEYVAAKKNIFQNAPQPRRVVLNRDNEIAYSFAKDVTGELALFSRREPVANGVWLDGDVIRAGEEPILPAHEIRIPGVHNIENYMAAFAALSGIASREAMVKTARTFPGVAHRIELVRELRGVRYYNDSIASSPSRTTAGLRSFPEKVILIAGGKDKGVPFDALGEEICRHVKKLVVTGWTAEKIRDAVLKAGGTMPIEHREDFREAVLTAASLAEAGDVVLLSPACTSFDHFKNFAERGDCFRKIIEELE